MGFPKRDELAHAASRPTRGRRAIEERLREDLGDESEELLALNAKADPLLAELWDNRRDAAYDRLRSR